MRLSDGFLDEIRLHNDIEATVAPYVQLKRGGRTLVGLCPFHSERTPSFVVYPETQSYYCFGCGAGGDVITFVRSIENLDYIDAVRVLADKAGIAMPADSYDDGLASMKKRTLEANREAAKFYHSVLLSDEGAPAAEYLKTRRLKPETVKHFGLGYAPDRWDSLIRHMRDLGFSDTELVNMDLARKTKNGGTIDSFRNRLMFPIIDLRGNVIAFGGRVLDDSKPKYLNTSDTVVYKKSQGVFALNFAKNGSGRTLILCEGYMDVIAYHQAGFTNAVAGLGTAFTADQAALLARYADEIMLSYDSDEAGIKATQKALSILGKTNLKLKVLHLSGGKDPDEIIRKFGPERMRDIINGSVNDLEFKLERLKEGVDVSTPDGRSTYLRAAVPVLASLNDSITLDIYAGKLASEMDVSKAAITEQVKKERRRRNKRGEQELFASARRAAAGNTVIRAAREQSQPAVVSAERIIIASLFNNPDFLSLVETHMNAQDFPDEFYSRVFSIISERIHSLKPVELTYFNTELTVEEMSKLSSVLESAKKIANTKQECLDCIKTIKDAAETTKIPPAEQMSDEDFIKIFQKLNS